MFFGIEEAKQTVLNFSKGMVKVLWFYIVSKWLNTILKCKIV